MRVLVTGANGQLGREIRKVQNSKHEFVFTDIEELDILDSGKTNTFINNSGFDYIINCAAYTAVDKAEIEVEKARAINKTAVENLVKAADKSGSTIIHISTDFIFDGLLSTPYNEISTENPINVYGSTKLEGEYILRNNFDKYYILRTSWLYSTFGSNFVKTIQKLAFERDSLNIIYDQIGTPTYAEDLADAIIKIIDKNCGEYGIYNYSNEGVASWYDFAKSIVEFSNLNCTISPIETKDYPTPAKRPHYSVLNKSKLKNVFGFTIPHWRESLLNCINGKGSE